MAEVGIPGVPVKIKIPQIPDIQIGGKKKKSSCRHVSPSDVTCFRAGSCASWVVADRVIDASQVWGNPQGLQIPEYIASLGLSFEDFADVHMNQFVPLCDKIEGGDANYTDDPNAGRGLQIYETARAAFKDQLRSGRIHWSRPPRGVSDQSSGRMGPDAGTQPTQAGGLLLALGAIALLASGS